MATKHLQHRYREMFIIIPSTSGLIDAWPFCRQGCCFQEPAPQAYQEALPSHSPMWSELLFGIIPYSRYTRHCKAAQCNTSACEVVNVVGMKVVFLDDTGVRRTSTSASAVLPQIPVLPPFPLPLPLLLLLPLPLPLPLLLLLPAPAAPTPAPAPATASSTATATAPAPAAADATPTPTPPTASSSGSRFCS